MDSLHLHRVTVTSRRRRSPSSLSLATSACNWSSKTFVRLLFAILGVTTPLLWLFYQKRIDDILTLQQIIPPHPPPELKNTPLTLHPFVLRPHSKHALPLPSSQARPRPNPPLKSNPPHPPLNSQTHPTVNIPLPMPHLKHSPNTPNSYPTPHTNPNPTNEMKSNWNWVDVR